MSAPVPYDEYLEVARVANQYLGLQRTKDVWEAMTPAAQAAEVAHLWSKVHTEPYLPYREYVEAAERSSMAAVLISERAWNEDFTVEMRKSTLNQLWTKINLRHRDRLRVLAEEEDRIQATYGDTW